MNIFKKLFGGQKTTEEVKQEKEKDFVGLGAISPV